MLATSGIHASNGQINLTSTNGKNYRCYAMSSYMANSSYNVLISCKDLIYPPDEGLFKYVVWANPSEGSGPQRLGELGVGTALYKTRTAFSSLFVTTEENQNTRSPQGATVMTGRVNPIPILENENVPTPNPEEASQEEIQPEDQTTNEMSTKDRLLLGLKRAGLVSFLALIAVIGLVFVLTRPKS